MAKKFFYVCAGILMLAGAFALGASTVTAQAPDNKVVGIAATHYMSNQAQYVVTENGDFYLRSPGNNWTQGQNVFDLTPVPTESESLGGVKGQYR